MRRRRYFSVLLLLLSFSKTWGQQVDSSRFFPLDVGNAWTYFNVLDPPNAPPDTIWGGTFTVSETMALNDTLYYLAGYPFALADTLRADEQGRIWARVRARDVLLFDFSLAEGGSYTFEPSHAPEHIFEVTIKRNLTVDVGAGRFEMNVNDCRITSASTPTPGSSALVRQELRPRQVLPYFSRSARRPWTGYAQVVTRRNHEGDKPKEEPP